MKFNHIGIFVKDIEEGREEISKLLNIKKVSKRYDDENLKVSVQFITDQSSITYEIVAPYGSGNPVDKVLDEKKNVLNHNELYYDHVIL